MEAWLGFCHFTKDPDDIWQNYQAIAAVFCDGREDYDAALKDYAHANGYQFLWSEEAHLAGQWLAKHPQERKAAELARSVHQGHTVEVGQLKLIWLEGEEEPEAEDWLIIEEIDGVEPLDAQFVQWPLKNVPDKLYEPLFGQPEPTDAEIEAAGGDPEKVPPMKTYAILDAAKMPYLLTGAIEASDLKYQSLFQGETQEELKEHAPYLIELDEDNSFTRKLFTGPKGVNGLWEKELGIYIRSRAGFDDIRRHFRKFTRVQDENGKWFYFAFWKGYIIKAFYFEECLQSVTSAFMEGIYKIWALDDSKANQIGFVGVAKRR